MKSHYTFENLERAIRNPVLIAREALRLTGWPIHQAYGKYIDRKCRDGIDVMENGWDNLVILDACRYDYFARQNTFDGKLTREISRGKKSWQFIEENFAGRELHDTVYVTANPFSTDIKEGTFYHTKHLHATDWNEEIGTVQPADVVEAAFEAHGEHPDKRIIVHFMQPHRPYLGETADALRERLEIQGYGRHNEGIQIWGAVKQGDVSIEEIRDAYSESLGVALEHVEDLLEGLSGKSVVTSDHGEMLGERVSPFTTRVWGHMEGFSTQTLREVPWLVINSRDRREIHKSTPIESTSNLDGKEIEGRLEALGYAD